MLSRVRSGLMRRLSDRFAEAAQACTDLPQLGALLTDVTLDLGFHHFALLDHRSLRDDTARLIRIDNYPESWVDEFLQSGFADNDPVHLASRHSVSAFGWSELDQRVALNARHRAILARSRRHGLGCGFTIPSNLPCEPSASCSFAVRCGSDLPVQRLRCAELIGIHALQAARRLRSKGDRPARPHLSRREVQCLRLVALGKTDWEIAAILDLSVETARQYVKRARAAYDTVSRAQLVAYGLRDHWIGFEDAIPPDG